MSILILYYKKLAKELGPYFLSLTGFIDMGMVDHVRKTFKTFFNNLVGMKRVFQRKLQVEWKVLKKPQREFMKKVVGPLSINGPFLNCLFIYDLLAPMQYVSIRNQSVHQL